LLLGLGGALTWLLGPLFGPWQFFLLFNLLMAGAVIADWFVTPGRARLRVTRECPARISLGAENPVRIQVENLGPHDLKLQIRDDYPRHCRIDRDQLALSVSAHTTTRAVYQLTPLRRGDFNFGPLSVRVMGVLGLVGKDFVQPASREVRAYPNMREISRFMMLSRKGLLSQSGIRQARIPGRGTEFESLREYLPDDEFRKINWKASARRGKLITTEFETERGQRVMILVDTGRMMAGRTAGMTRLDHAINAALYLSFVAMEKGDTVGLLSFGDRVRSYLPPRKGRRQLQNIMERLYNVEASLSEPDFAGAFRMLALSNRRRSLVVVFTDLVDSETSRALVKYLGSLAPTHLPILVVGQDTALVEQAAALAADSGELYRKAVAEQVLFSRERTLGFLRNRGVLVVDVPVENLSSALVNRYLEVKLRGRL